jgi:uroporphyrinogen decarboxylase
MDLDRLARQLVAETRANGGLAPVDLDRFWADQAKAAADPFGADIPQVPLGIMMGSYCLFDELGLPETPENWHRLFHDGPWLKQACDAYNRKAREIVGRDLLRPAINDHTKPGESRGPRTLADLFEAKNVWHNESYWLQQSANTEDELKALLDRVEKRLENLAAFVLPEGWEKEKARLVAAGRPLPAYRSQRGPCTFATSIYGAEPTIFLVMDQPDLAARLRDAILRGMLGIARVLDEDAGRTRETEPRGFSFFDDNCCLFTPPMYEFFGYPILKAVFERYAPGPNDRRYQHSDSPMGHLLPILARLNFHQVNFGPTLTVSQIREHMPRTVIQGQLAPFTFSRNEEEKIVREFLRDFEQAKEKRGLLFDTAGSVNNGSRLTGMRLLMAAIQRYGRY